MVGGVGFTDFLQRQKEEHAAQLEAEKNAKDQVSVGVESLVAAIQSPGTRATRPEADEEPSAKIAKQNGNRD